MDDVKLLPCPFCGGTDTTVEGLGMVWSGVKGYSAPQWYELRHWGVLSQDDPFNRCDIILRCRSEAEAIAAWNMRTPAWAEGLREALLAIEQVERRSDGTYRFRKNGFSNGAEAARAAILARAAEIGGKADE